MATPVRLLLVEDSEDDALLIAHQLARHTVPIELVRVETEAQLQSALENGGWDIVISDYQLPGFDGLAALELVRAHSIELPFIIVSATIGEEIAVEAMRSGANDYVMKNKLARLLPAFERELRESAARRARHAERQAQQAKIEHLSRVKEVMSGINALIIRARDRDELFREACRLAVVQGRFALAWIGTVSEGGRGVELVAMHSALDELREVMLDAIRARAYDSRGAVLDAVAARRPSIHNDIARDPAAVCGPQCARLGAGSLVVLPLNVEGKVVGVLTLLAQESGFFDAQEMRLLEELAGDIAFALDHIAKQERIDYLAYYDAVTGLANRTLFCERLGQLIGAKRPPGTRLVVCVLELERLSTVNDTLGRHAGDALVAQLSARMVACLGDAGRAARIGADRLAFVLPDVAHEREIVLAASRCLEGMTGEPARLGGTVFSATARAGIALHPQDGGEADLLLRNAEAAVAKARDAGEPYLFYMEEMTARIASKLALETRLRSALANGEYLLHYQPKVDIGTRRILSVEALIRWQSPELGLVPPASFVSLLEETGMIVEVGEWAMRQAARDHRAWERGGLQAPRIAVNVSVGQLRQADFVAVVREAVDIAAGPPGIDLEITESLFVDDYRAVIDKLEAIRALGMDISIDDFGTGYSSLGYLAKLPVNSLKIDGSFVAAMVRERQAKSLVEAIITMAHALGLKVVAECVETEEQAAMLQAMGCDQIQGYLTGRPMPLEELTALLATPPRSARAG